MKSRLVSWTSVWILSALALVLIVAAVVVGLCGVTKAPAPYTVSPTSPDDWPSYLPLYLEIERVGDLFQAAYSTDGNAYTLLPGSSITLVLPTQALLGLAASAGKAGASAATSFGVVTIGAPKTAPTTAPLTTFCPVRWTCADIGNPSLAGSQVLHSGTWTIQGGRQRHLGHLGPVPLCLAILERRWQHQRTDRHPKVH